MKNLLAASLILLFTAFLNSCKVKDASECDIEGVICTEVFTTKYVSVKDPSGTPIALDSIVVKVSASEEVLFSENPVLNDDGLFKLISDTEFDKITKEGTDVTFFGYIEGVSIVTENLRVGHDCCHVVYISGVQDIVVTLP